MANFEDFSKVRKSGKSSKIGQKPCAKAFRKTKMAKFFLHGFGSKNSMWSKFGASKQSDNALLA